MDGSRFCWLTVLALTLAVLINPIASSQTSPPRSEVFAPQVAAPTPYFSKVYTLNPLGDDPTLGAWITETIPQVIQPGTWGRQNRPAPGTLSYFAPAKVMVVYHTAAVHSQVDEFLKNLKKALPQGKNQASTKTDSGLVQAQFTAPNASKPADLAPNKSVAYPIPTPAQQPKHLFHLILRYEGDGEVASVVEELAKNYSGNGSAKEEKTDKAKTEPAKPTGNQLFQFIVRYEGEGLIDASVVELMKAYQDKAAADSARTTATYSVVPAPPQNPPVYYPTPVPAAPTPGPKPSIDSSLPPQQPSPPASSANPNRMPPADDGPSRGTNSVPPPPPPPIPSSKTERL